MIFKVDRDEAGEITRVYTYACVGKILGHELFSFNVLARDNSYSLEQIEDLIKEIDPEIVDKFEMSKMKFTTADDWATTCVGNEEFIQS